MIGAMVSSFWALVSLVERDTTTSVRLPASPRPGDRAWRPCPAVPRRAGLLLSAFSV